MNRLPLRPLGALILVGLLALLGACAGLAFTPGVTSEDDVLRQWGPPAQRWAEPDGGQRLVYPRGPLGYTTWMVLLGADGRLRSAANVLTEEEFAQVRAGESQEQILRRFGPPSWIQHFDQRNELVWEWRYCDQWTHPARFNVLFDSTTGLVRSTLQLEEDLGRRSGFCSR